MKGSLVRAESFGGLALLASIAAAMLGAGNQQALILHRLSMNAPSPAIWWKRCWPKR